ncbi:MAG: peptidoglycan DD-metalloendopeptidase family protein [Alistipes sp.]|nr:peptidoglycan DD-metalloendopeptidase family protein [Alistipes sp.]
MLIGGALGVVLAGVLLWWGLSGGEKSEDILGEEIQETTELLYGIDYSDLTLDEGVIRQGETLSAIFARYGMSPAMVDRTARAADSVFSLRNIRAGNDYTVFLSQDSLPRLVHFVYEHNLTDYLVISFEGDSVAVRREKKDVTIERRRGTAQINSSLWNAVVGEGMPASLAMELEEVYQWTIDFFGLQKEDRFTVIYDERYVDSTSAGIGRIWGAVFTHGGKDYYAIPFEQGDKVTYWDEVGNSLRKAMLKAPLKYSRISSKFSNARLHPVHRIVRPHHGVDYAAPSGTPVHAVADGTVSFKGWDSKGGGNTLKIKHNSRLETGYLHLRGFAPGIAVGKRVSQGDLIGYVGMTGTATGPHLDYRVWQDGKAVDPLRMTSEPAEPIADSSIARFMLVRDRIVAELRGELPDSLVIRDLENIPGELPDSLRPELPPVAPVPVDSTQTRNSADDNR